jgi:Mn-containing catalase
MQYMFQAFGARGPAKYRDMLMHTAAEELGHIEMLATAVALNLENAPVSLQEEVANDQLGGAVLNGMDMRHVLSTALGGSAPCPRTPTACRSMPRTSMPAATSPPT